MLQSVWLCFRYQGRSWAVPRSRSWECCEDWNRHDRRTCNTWRQSSGSRWKSKSTQTTWRHHFLCIKVDLFYRGTDCKGHWRQVLCHWYSECEPGTLERPTHWMYCLHPSRRLLRRVRIFRRHDSSAGNTSGNHCAEHHSNRCVEKLVIASDYCLVFVVSGTSFNVLISRSLLILIFMQTFFWPWVPTFSVLFKYILKGVSL